MKNLDLSTLTSKQLIVVHNAVSTTEVKGFKSTADGVEKVTALLEASTKGKANKAALQTGVSKLPLVILTVLSAAIPFAKDLSVKVLPAHQRVLKTMLDAGLDKATMKKDEVCKLLGIKPDSARFATAIEGLYKLLLITWSDEDDIGLTDAAINFVNANGDAFDSETVFEELAVEPEKKKKVSEGGPGNRSKIPGDAVIVPLYTVNPCTPGKARHADYEKFNPGMTVDEYRAAGGVMFNLIDAVKRVRVRLDVGKDKGVIPEITPYEKWR